MDPPSEDAGARRNSGSEQMAKAAESQAQATAKGLNLGTVETKGGFGAGAGGGFGLNAPGFKVKVMGPQAAKGSNIPVDQEIVDAWTRVMDDSDPLGWVIAKYKVVRLPLETGKGLELLASGEGGLTAFKAALPQNDLAWGAFRIQAVDKRGELESKRPKFIFVHYACENVGQIRKAKMAGHKSDAKHAFIDCHMDIMIEKPDDLEEQDLMKRLQASTGAHKPNGYEFDAGVFLESDYYGLGIGENCKGESADKQAQASTADIA